MPTYHSTPHEYTTRSMCKNGRSASTIGGLYNGPAPGPAPLRCRLTNHSCARKQLRVRRSTREEFATLYAGGARPSPPALVTASDPPMLERARSHPAAHAPHPQRRPAPIPPGPAPGKHPPPAAARVPASSRPAAASLSIDGRRHWAAPQSRAAPTGPCRASPPRRRPRQSTLLGAASCCAAAASPTPPRPPQSQC